MLSKRYESTEVDRRTVHLNQYPCFRKQKAASILLCKLRQRNKSCFNNILKSRDDKYHKHLLQINTKAVTKRLRGDYLPTTDFVLKLIQIKIYLTVLYVDDSLVYFQHSA